MVDKVIPYLINLGQVIPARSKALLLNEITMALIECINIYGSKKLDKMGKINKVATCFWPVRLIPLTDTRASVCSYLLNKQEKLKVGPFSQTPPPPNNVIKAPDPETFLDSLSSYNKSYLSKKKYFKRATVIQEALFSTNEIGYFKNFFLNQYNLSSFGEPSFVLEGDPIAKSVNQIKIIQDIYDYVALKDVKMLDDYGQQIIQLCDKWLKKSTQKVEQIKGTTVDTREEEKQLARLNSELKTEKERDLKNKPEELLKSGNYRISDKTSEFNKHINNINNAVDRIKNAVNQKDLFLLDEGMNELNLRYNDLGNSISRYETELSQLKKNLDKESRDIENSHRKKISDLESRISEVEKDIDQKHKGLRSDLATAEDINLEIKNEKQSCLDNIEAIKDSELTDLQQFFNDYTIEIKTQNIVVGIPIFIFYFVDPNTSKTSERVPVLPLMIENGKVQRTKVTDSFRKELTNLMNKYTPMVNLVENEGEKNNLMESIKNFDTQVEDAINDLRMQKILGKKSADQAKDVINNLMW
ncbi:MAG: hypothetical protein EU539_12225 [Promethearchaeota archaeon]|nr:MAG: hypothetical protein EU539_12225 [Candidatus Lokiarchaeota archaeon]